MRVKRVSADDVKLHDMTKVIMLADRHRIENSWKYPSCSVYGWK